MSNPLMPAAAAAAPVQRSGLQLLQESTSLPANWWLYSEAWEAIEKLCSRLAGASMVPQDFQGKPGNVFVALMAGLPLGLSALTCLQSIAVINGRPTLWGDAPVAQVLAHPSLVNIEETVSGTIKEGNRAHTVKVTRRLPSGVVRVVERSFSMDDAKTAKLWDKRGSTGQPTPWVTAPDRMLYNRARAFALRDSFADVLRGIRLAADADDGEPETIRPATFAVEAEAGAPAVQEVRITSGFVPEPEEPKPPAKEPRTRGKGKSKADAEPAAAAEAPKMTSADARGGEIVDPDPMGIADAQGQPIADPDFAVDDAATQPMEPQIHNLAKLTQQQPAEPKEVPLTKPQQTQLRAVPNEPEAAKKPAGLAHLPGWANMPQHEGVLGVLTVDGRPRTVHLSLAVWTAKHPMPNGKAGDVILRLLPGAADQPQLFVHAGSIFVTGNAKDQALVHLVRDAIVQSIMVLAPKAQVAAQELLAECNALAADTGQELDSFTEATLRTLVVFRAHLFNLANGTGAEV